MSTETDRTPEEMDEFALEDAQDAAPDGSTDDESDLDDRSTEEDSVRETDSYFDDDDAILDQAGDDAVIERDGEIFAKQAEGLVAWRIENLYDDDGKVKNRFALMRNPPVLVVEDGDDSASFLLTKQLSATLARNFDDIHRAFSGVKPKSEMTFKDRLLAARDWALRHKVLSILILLVIGAMIAGLVVN